MVSWTNHHPPFTYHGFLDHLDPTASHTGESLENPRPMRATSPWSICYWPPARRRTRGPMPGAAKGFGGGRGLGILGVGMQWNRREYIYIIIERDYIYIIQYFYSPALSRWFFTMKIYQNGGMWMYLGYSNIITKSEDLLVYNGD